MKNSYDDLDNLLAGYSYGARKINEAKAKSPGKLADELEEIKELADEYGREYFTQMPFTSFDNDSFETNLISLVSASELNFCLTLTFLVVSS